MKHGSFSSGNTVLRSLSWPQTVCVAKAGLEFRILLTPFKVLGPGKHHTWLRQASSLLNEPPGSHVSTCLYIPTISFK